MGWKSYQDMTRQLRAALESGDMQLAYNIADHPDEDRKILGCVSVISLVDERRERDR